MTAMVIPIGSEEDMRVLHAIARSILQRLHAHLPWPTEIILHPATLAGRYELWGVPIYRTTAMTIGQAACWSRGPTRFLR